MMFWSQNDIATPASVLVNAGRDVVMDAATAIRATNNIVIRADGSLDLAQLQATNVGLNVGANIVDVNGASTNVRASNFSARAGGRIGDADVLNVPDANDNAIDTEVTTLAAFSQQAMYLQEVALGADLVIGPVAAFGVSVDVDRVNFNSSTQATNRADSQLALGELTATTGPIKVTVDAGVLTIVDGVRSLASGDILLRSAVNDVVLDNGTIVSSNGGHISLIAGDDIQQAGNITAAGTGTVLLAASNNIVDGLSGIEMRAGTSIVAADGNVRILADNEGDILLARIETHSNVSLIAEGSILDNNAASELASDASAGQNQITVANVAGFAVGDIVTLQDSNSSAQITTISAIAGNILTLVDNLATDFSLANSAFVAALNVQAEALRMVADAALSNLSNLSGSIGLADTLNGVATRNANAIDTHVSKLAATSADGIYVQEFDALAVDATGDIQVQQVRFKLDHYCGD